MLRATPATAAELLIGKAVPVLAVLLQQAVVIGCESAGTGDRIPKKARTGASRR
jgi:ABC-type Na+ efflux pump permease subunit